MREFEFCPALRRSSSSEQDEDEELLESLPKSLLPGAPPLAPPAQLPMIKEQEERRPPAFELHVSRLLGHRLEHDGRARGRRRFRLPRQARHAQRLPTTARGATEDGGRGSRGHVGCGMGHEAVGTLEL